jgi:integrase
MYATGPDGKRVRVVGGFALDWSEPVEPSSFYRSLLKPAAVAIGEPRLRLHDLRHTFASMWLQLGGDIKELSKQMGHEKVSTTLDFYAHLQPEDEDAPHVLDEAAPDMSNVVPLRRAAG